MASHSIVLRYGFMSLSLSIRLLRFSLEVIKALKFGSA